LRLSAEDWTRFGSSAQQVLQTFDDDSDQENAFYRFANVVILLEAQTKFPEAPTDPGMGDQAIEFMGQRIRELAQLGVDMQQYESVADKWFKR
jgi:hypothetical protein